MLIRASINQSISGDACETVTRRLSNVPAQIANLTPCTETPPCPKPPRPLLSVLSNLTKHRANGEPEIPSTHPTVIITDFSNRKQQQQLLSVNNVC